MSVRVCIGETIPLFRMGSSIFSYILGFLDDREVCNIKTTCKASRKFVNDSIAGYSDKLSLLFLLNQPIIKLCEEFYNPYTNQYIQTLDKLKGRVRQLFSKDITISEPVINATISKLLDPTIVIFTSKGNFADNLITLIKGLKKEDTVGKYELCLRIFNILRQLEEEHELNADQVSAYQLSALNLHLTLPTRASSEIRSLSGALTDISDELEI